MSDPVAQAAAQLAAEAAPSSTEPSLLEKAMETIHTLEEKVEHLIHPDAPEVAHAGEPSSQPSSGASGAEEGGAAVVGESLPQDSQDGSAVNASPQNLTSTRSEEATVSGAGATTAMAISSDLPNAATAAASSGARGDTGEHPHTTLLRRLTTTLRRKFNMFDGELEALLKDAESHL